MDWGILSILVSAVTLVAVVFAGGRYVGALDTLVKRHDLCPVSKIDKDLAVLTSRFDSFLSTIEAQAPKALIAPHTPERDALLRKMVEHQLNKDEAGWLVSDIENDVELLKSNKSLAAILVLVQLKDMLNGWRV